MTFSQTADFEEKQTLAFQKCKKSEAQPEFLPNSPGPGCVCDTWQGKTHETVTHTLPKQTGERSGEWRMAERRRSIVWHCCSPVHLMMARCTICDKEVQQNTSFKNNTPWKLPRHSSHLQNLLKGAEADNGAGIGTVVLLLLITSKLFKEGNLSFSLYRNIGKGWASTSEVTIHGLRKQSFLPDRKVGLLSNPCKHVWVGRDQQGPCYSYSQWS